jgi:hypothetical protein
VAVYQTNLVERYHHLDFGTILRRNNMKKCTCDSYQLENFGCKCGAEVSAKEVRNEVAFMNFSEHAEKFVDTMFANPEKSNQFEILVISGLMLIIKILLKI